MLSAAELRGRANSVSASHTVIPVSSAGPSAACMPVQFQPHALIRAPQLSGLELAEKGCHSAQNCSVPRLRCWLCHRSSLGRTRVLPLAKKKKNGHAVLQWTQKHIYIVPDTVHSDETGCDRYLSSLRGLITFLETLKSK